MSIVRRAEIARRIARRRARERRRPILLAGGAAVTVALTTALSIASFTGVDLANAAVERAKSLAELMNMRSPGERTEGELTKTKHKALALAEHIPPTVVPTPPVLADALVPPVAALVPVSVEVPAVAQFAPPIPPGVIFSPPPGVFAPPCCSIVPLSPPPGPPPPPPPGPPPPPPPGPPPPPPPPGPPPPPPPPPVPEPGTWMTMVLGFGLIGWAMRRRPGRSVRSTI